MINLLSDAIAYGMLLTLAVAVLGLPVVMVTSIIRSAIR